MTPIRIMDEITLQFARIIREKRLSLGLSQDAVAVAAHISQSVLSKLEAARQNPSMLIALRVLKALDLTMDEVFREN